MEEHKITFTYLNIRQSIVILLAKLVSIDLILILLILGLYWILVLGENFFGLNFASTPLFIILFGIIGIIKIFLTFYVTLLWLNEYYEITPEYIYHKQGIIFRKINEYRIDNIRRVNVHDTFFGELFNYATIAIYDLGLNKYLDLYLIHNPQRYISILKQLNPEIETEKERVRMPFLPKEQTKETNSGL